MSQNEKYYYYILDIFYYPLSTGRTSLIQSSVNNGVLSTNSIYSLTEPSRYIPGLVATNNRGSVAFVIENYDTATFVATSYEIMRINEFGVPQTMATILGENFSVSNIKINDQNTVFVQNSKAPQNIVAYLNPGVKLEIDSGTTLGRGSMQTTNIVTPENFEGVIYYLKNNQIMSSQGKSVVFEPNKPVRDFFVASGSFFYLASVNSNQYFVRNNEVLLSTGSIVNGINARSFLDLRGNNRSEVSFSVYDDKPSPTVHLVKYSERTCTVSAKTGKEVTFFSQDNPDWKNVPYAYGPRLRSGQSQATARQIADNRMTIVGCVTTGLAMLFDYYGIDTLPKKSNGDANPVNPESLNEVFKVISDLNFNTYSVYDDRNDVKWAEAANAGRSIFQNKCYLDASLEADFQANRSAYKSSCVTQSKSQISYKSRVRWGQSANGSQLVWDANADNSKKDGFKIVEEEICKGNPVLLRVGREVGGELKTHTVIAIASEFNADGELTFRVNDPSRVSGTKDITLETLATRNTSVGPQYRHVVGYDLYKPVKDPSMISILSSPNLDFVVTDNLGRRAGFDPTTQTKYEEIPIAVYSYEAVAPNFQNGETEISENLPAAKSLFLSENVQSGNYQVKTFSNVSGEGFLTVSKTDVDGFTNDTDVFHFDALLGTQEVFNFNHSVEPLPAAATEVKINFASIKLDYSIENYARYDLSKTLPAVTSDIVTVYGEYLLANSAKISCSDAFKFAIGSGDDYNLSIAMSQFRRKVAHNMIFFEYDTPEYKIIISENGLFWVELRSVNLRTINNSKWGKILVGINNEIGRTDVRFNCYEKNCGAK